MFRVPASVLLVLVTASMSACGLFSRHDAPYQDSRNQPPLQVPDDLDRPGADEALRIPEPTPARDIRSSAMDGSGPPTAIATNTNLIIADTPQSAWRRVGLALERMSGDVDILERDEDALRYRLEMSGTQPARGFFRRLFRRDELVRESFDLQFEPSVDGTHVRAVGGGDMARALLKRLQQRLG